MCVCDFILVFPASAVPQRSTDQQNKIFTFFFNLKKEKKVPAKVLRAFYILRNNNSKPGIVDGHSHFFVSFFLAHAHAIRQNPVRGLYDRDARAQRVRARNSF